MQEAKLDFVYSNLEQTSLELILIGTPQQWGHLGASPRVKDWDHQCGAECHLGRRGVLCAFVKWKREIKWESREILVLLIQVERNLKYYFWDIFQPFFPFLKSSLDINSHVSISIPTFCLRRIHSLVPEGRELRYWWASRFILKYQVWSSGSSLCWKWF